MCRASINVSVLTLVSNGEAFGRSFAQDFSKRSVRAIFMSEIREHRDHQKDLRTNIDFYTESTVKTGEIKR